MAAAVLRISMPPGSISGVGRVSSSSGFPGWFRTTTSPLGTAGLLGSEGERRGALYRGDSDARDSGQSIAACSD